MRYNLIWIKNFQKEKYWPTVIRLWKMELSRRDFGSWSSITIFMQGLCREKFLENLKFVFGKNRVFLFLSSGLVKLDETGAVLTMSPGTASLRLYVWLQTLQAVETWTREERRVTTREIQEWFSIRTAATVSLFLGHLRVKKRCARCPHPHSLTEEQDGVSMSGCGFCDEKKKEKKKSKYLSVSPVIQ